MNTTLATHLKETRINKGLTQEALAELSKVSLRTIQRIELGQVVPRNSTLSLITEVLEVVLPNEKDNGAHEPLRLLKLMNFLIIISLPIPVLNILIPVVFLLICSKYKFSNTSVKRMISFQIIWGIGTILLFFLGVFLSNLITGNAGNGLYIGLIIYVLSALYNIYILLGYTFKLNKGKSELSAFVPNFF